MHKHEPFIGVGQATGISGEAHDSIRLSMSAEMSRSPGYFMSKLLPSSKFISGEEEDIIVSGDWSLHLHIQTISLTISRRKIIQKSY